MIGLGILGAAHRTATAATTLWSSNPPIVTTRAPGTDGPLSIGAEFYVTQPGCYLKGFKFYEVTPTGWSTGPTAALYLVGGTTPVTSTVTVPIADLYATASTTWSSSYLPSNATDGNTTTYWVGRNRPTVAVPQWLRLTGASAITATEYKIAGHSNTTYGPRDWTFQGSNDGTNWTVLDTRTAVTTNATIQTFTFANTTAYKSYRLNITDNGGEAGSVWMAEFSVTGLTPLTNPTAPAWMEGDLASPYALAQGTKYRAVFLFGAMWPGSHGSISTNLVSGPLTVPAGANATNNNHTYTYGAAMVNPTSSTGASYAIDVVIQAPA